MYPNVQKNASPYSGVQGGDGIRVSRITFIVDDTVAKPQLTMKGEAPFTEYNFEVRGCIGQPDFTKPKRYCDPATLEE